MKVEVIFIFVSSFGLAAAEVSKWGYANTVFKKHSNEPEVAGPLDWDKVNENCGKAFQSPINIVPEDTEQADFEDFEFQFNNELHGGMIGTLRNNGRALVYKLKNKRNDNDQNIMVSQATFMPTPYRLHRVKVHFGCDDSQGSEHLLEGQRFAGEIQLTFFDDNYRSFEKAMNQTKPKVVIFAVFLKKGMANNQIERLDDALQNIREEGKKEKDVELSIMKMIPNLRNNALYYTYELGTLTIPPCTQNIRWIVLKEPVTISEAQLDSLRNLESKYGQDGHHMCNNYRPVQETEGRQIQRNFDLF